MDIFCAHGCGTKVAEYTPRRPDGPVPVLYVAGHEPALVNVPPRTVLTPEQGVRLADFKARVGAAPITVAQLDELIDIILRRG